MSRSERPIARYADPFDDFPRNAIRPKRAASPEEWRAADVALVARAFDHLPDKGACSAIDVGAGQGRLVPAIGARASSMVLLEPDLLRARIAGQVAARLPECDAEVVVADATTYTTYRKFDVIVCSHVIQHVTSSHRRPLLESLRNLCAPWGVLLMTYPNTDNGKEAYYISEQEASAVAVATSEATRSAFDRCIAGSGGTSDGVKRLGIWHSAMEDVPQLHTSSGFRVLDHGAYRWFEHWVRFKDGRTLSVPACDAYTISVVQ